MKWKNSVLQWVWWMGAVVVALGTWYAGGGSMSAAAGTAPRPVCNAGANNNRAAITFDTSWGSDKTKEILEILDIYDAKATFFVTGFWAQANPELVRQIVQCGHEVGNHSTSHQDMTGMTQEEMISEIERTSTMLEGIAGVHPTLFRPPFGSYNTRMLTTAQALGYDVVQWDIDTRDYDDLTVEEIMRRVTPHARDGSIVLFQNNSRNVTGALVQTLEHFNSMDLRAVTVGELIGPGEYTVDMNGNLVRMGQ
ncbi:MAG: polysaccharide deacetylase family protein [Eubacteriales bacterium]|nr:polysaccharide deacetylase family protein [Eubacteriales bacterium]